MPDTWVLADGASRTNHLLSAHAGAILQGMCTYVSLCVIIIIELKWSENVGQNLLCMPMGLVELYSTTNSFNLSACTAPGTPTSCTSSWKVLDVNGSQ
jgi:hypothetical protein